MPLNAQLTAQVADLKRQFIGLVTSTASIEIAAATDLLLTFEQQLLILAKEANSIAHPSTDLDIEIVRYIQSQLNWLALQVDQLKQEKTQISEQLLQISRARKGNASYDEHKSG